MNPTIEVHFEPSSVEARIVAPPGTPETLWARVREAAVTAYPERDEEAASIRLPWANGLVLIRELANLQRVLGFRLQPIGDAANRIESFKKQFVEARKGSSRPTISPEQIQAELAKFGFVRELKHHQTRDLSKLISLGHGANFSVPGAGKTTVAFALHLLLSTELPYLLVVSPKNAFGAWDDVIVDSLDPTIASEQIRQGFLRLSGDESETRLLLKSGHKRFLVNYERVIKLLPILQAFLLDKPVHMTLDESHRIKGGEARLRGQALLRLAPFARRRDILTGTPAPHSIYDLGPQLEFLWPATGTSDRILTATSPGSALKGLFVRTTKSELQLPPATRSFERVAMSDTQAALYALLKSEFLRKFGKQQLGGAFDAFRARSGAVRLLQASTYPVLAARGIGEFLDPDDNAARIARAVIQANDPPKLLRACQIARERAATSQKTILWTIFLETIARLRSLLIDLNPIELHGGIPTGDPSEPGTRENQIRRFHEDPHSMVVVANPAACGEGISLHHACHVAVYLDRSYNAAHYLQSIDRIHRLGLPPTVLTEIIILQSTVPQGLGSVDHSVSRRLGTKIRTMQQILDDQDLHEIALDEENADVPIESDITLEDLYDLIEQLATGAIPSEDEAA